VAHSRHAIPFGGRNEYGSHSCEDASPRRCSLRCRGAPGGGEGSGGYGRPLVVAAVAPLAELARAVGGDRVRVEDVTPPGAEPHDVELTADRVEALHAADVVVVVGGGFQPAVEEAAGDGDALVVELGEPHAWLDPVRMAGAVDLVADALAGADPGGEGGYRERAAAVQAGIEALHQRYEQTLAGCRRRTIVTAHAAFGRLAARYGLREEAIAGSAPEAEPSPARIAEVAQLVRREGLTTVFAEPLLDEGVARTVAGEAGAGVAVLDPVESLAGGDTYLTVMDRNLGALSAALDCPPVAP
jgi:zinc transport system substrate-binding protein